ncbi:MAG: PDZ domain-containing protein [Planctomycetes bacterium]|nr:PDZ domain-containing protein [Planctomycetota bacterium]
MRTRLAAASLLFATGLASARAQAPEAAPDARQYLEAALDQIEQGSRVYATDWQALRGKALAAIAAAGAKSPADTYPAIRDALANLGDPHGRLLEPDAAKQMASRRPAKSTGLLVVPRTAVVAQVLPGSPAEAAGLAPGDRIVAVDGVPGFADLKRFEQERLFRCGQRPDCSTAPLELAVRRGTAEPRAVQVPLATFDEHQAPTGRRLDGGIGYLELPGASGPEAANYDDAVHALLGQLDDGTLRGCIVDLRRNAGGKIEPMLAGIGPLAGTGKLGAYASAHNSSEWSYDAARGAAIFEGYELASVASPHRLRDDLPVAVLTGPVTAQAGEALVVVFAGRARTRRFGEGTRGVPVGTTTKSLADGALIVLTATVQADRTGARYDGVIAPDEPVAIDWTRFGAADDPVVVAASRWLLSLDQAK